ncbi:AMP-binding protein [Actinosynnema sp. NPDC020468]|uniref:AMP-binding protein n=1 Tax=Actinosynnema sp. NPDC020468 TaxID=3154488 RepID=UPI0033E8AF59
MTGLLDWLEHPRPDRGIDFATDTGWERWTHPELAGHAHAVARGLVAAGTRRGDRVLLVLRSGPGFVAALFGAVLAGVTPCPVAPPAAFGDGERYRRHWAGVVAAVEPSGVVTEADLVGSLPDRAWTVEELAQRTGPDVVIGPAETALVQFTSGSSDRPRPVAVSRNALEATLEATRRWLGYTPDDAGASWLPVHHDMGLVGCLLTPLWCRADLWLMRPEQFLRRPERYLELFGRRGAAITAMPAFGLDHVVRRARRDPDWDFTAWRAVVVGAERVRAETLTAFADFLSPQGFHPHALLPAYGLAEATLVVTGVRPGTGWRVAEGLVGCGPPVDGARVVVLGEDGVPVPAGVVGEIGVAGPGVTSGEHLTGDVGFLRDGQLHVVGRRGDSVKVRGRAVFAEDVEAALAEAGADPRRVAVALGLRDGEPGAVAVVEGAAAEPADLVGVLRRAAQGADVRVVRGAVPRTTSGKPRRGELWRRFG